MAAPIKLLSESEAMNIYPFVDTQGQAPQFDTDTACEGPSCAQASTPCPIDIATAKFGNVGTYGAWTFSALPEDALAILEAFVARGFELKTDGR